MKWVFQGLFNSVPYLSEDICTFSHQNMTESALCLSTPVPTTASSSPSSFRFETFTISPSRNRRHRPFYSFICCCYSTSSSLSHNSDTPAIQATAQQKSPQSSHSPPKLHTGMLLRRTFQSLPDTFPALQHQQDDSSSASSTDSASSFKSSSPSILDDHNDQQHWDDISPNTHVLIFECFPGRCTGALVLGVPTPVRLGQLLTNKFTHFNDNVLYAGGQVGTYNTLIENIVPWYWVHRVSGLKGSVTLSVGDAGVLADDDGGVSGSTEKNNTYTPLYMGGNIEEAAKLIQGGQCTPQDFMFFWRHLVWGLGQLEKEIQAGLWKEEHGIEDLLFGNRQP